MNTYQVIKKVQKNQHSPLSSKAEFIYIAKSWHTDNLKRWSKNHSVTIWRRIEIHLLPSLGNKPLYKITTYKVSVTATPPI